MILPCGCACLLQVSDNNNNNKNVLGCRSLVLVIQPSTKIKIAVRISSRMAVIMTKI